MSPEQFDAHVAAGYSCVPVYSEILADLDTPLSTYLKLAQRPFSFLLESVQGGEKWGRYSIIGLPCRKVIKISGREVQIEVDGAIVETLSVEDPLAWVEAYQQRYRAPDIEGLPRFVGGLVGYFGYECIGYIEPRTLREQKPDPLGTPDILLMVADEVVVFDNLSGKLHIIVNVDPSEDNAYLLAEQRLNHLKAEMRRPTPYMSARQPRRVDETQFESGFTEAGYKAAVQTAKDYIEAGDCMQVVLSQRLSIPFEATALDLYRALRVMNPSPYMYYLDLGDHQVVGASPEILVRLEEGEVTVRPIAGTRPRGADAAEDKALEQDLLADPKELAEHLMLIDLGRNDVGRIADIGSVAVTDKMVVERYSHVMHIVSNVVGQISDRAVSAVDVLRATFPAGTVSGSPKIRAMEIVNELEPVKRGIYSGAVGYLSWNGSMDTAIAIRTAVIKDRTLSIQAGAGIVYDSNPDSEWDETMNKGRAVFKAVAMAEAGL